jgi:hypothetical protein
MTTRDERQAEVQAWLDTLSIVERHRVCWALNRGRWNATMKLAKYDVGQLEIIARVEISTGTAGRKDN